MSEEPADSSIGKFRFWQKSAADSTTVANMATSLSFATGPHSSLIPGRATFRKVQSREQDGPGRTFASAELGPTRTSAPPLTSGGFLPVRRPAHTGCNSVRKGRLLAALARFLY